MIKGVRQITVGALGVKPVDRNGLPLCYWCLKKLPVRRRSWCSDACFKSFTILQLAKELAIERDQFICQICGLDTKTELPLLADISFLVRTGNKLLKRYHQACDNKKGAIFTPEEMADLERIQEKLYEWQQLRPEYLSYKVGKATKLYRESYGRVPLKYQGDLQGIPRRTRAHVFEVDHIIPVSLGGTTTLDNLRTLCCRCHHAETKKLKYMGNETCQILEE